MNLKKRGWAPYRRVASRQKKLLVGLVGGRDEEKCAYSSLTLYWTVILGLFQHLRSRNQMAAKAMTLHTIGISALGNGLVGCAARTSPRTD